MLTRGLDSVIDGPCQMWDPQDGPPDQEEKMEQGADMDAATKGSVHPRRHRTR